MCGGMGLPELLIILAIVVLIFGASRLPQLGKALGETVRNFKSGTDAPDQVDEKEAAAAPIEAKVEMAELVEEAEEVEKEAVKKEEVKEEG